MFVFVPPCIAYRSVIFLGESAFYGKNKQTNKQTNKKDNKTDLEIDVYRKISYISFAMYCSEYRELYILF